MPLLTPPGQTYEGGISGQPNAEAHGAYAFCALGCLALLDHPARSMQRYAAWAGRNVKSHSMLMKRTQLS